MENAIHDLKYGMGLNHLPSGTFAANGAWLSIQVIAHRDVLVATAGRVRPDCPPAHPPPARPLAVGGRLDLGPGEAASNPTPGLTAL